MTKWIRAFVTTWMTKKTDQALNKFNAKEYLRTTCKLKATVNPKAIEKTDYSPTRPSPVLQCDRSSGCFVESSGDAVYVGHSPAKYNPLCSLLSMVRKSTSFRQTPQVTNSSLLVSFL